MKTNMEDIDKLIKETLTQEEAKFYNELEAQNVFEMLAGIFKGKNSWAMLLMSVVSVVVFGLLIYCVLQFFDAEATKELIKWSAASFVCLIAIGMLKLFAWMQMDKNAILREMKRLELQISALHGKISD